MNIYLKAGIAALVVVAAVFGWYWKNAAELPVNKTPEGYQLIGKLETEGMQDFSLNRLDGTSLKLGDYKGKVIVLNFWASWCNPCVQEFASMVELVEKMKGEVVVVAVSTDDDRADVEAFLKAFGLPKPNFEIVWDKDKTVMAQYGINKLPESFIVGRDFKLARKVLGLEEWASDGAIGYFKSLMAQPVK